jgi:hypothetical protein
MNDWMDQEILRQAAEAGDPSAQTASWAVPVRQRPAVQAAPLFLALGVVAIVTVLALLAAASLS